MKIQAIISKLIELWNEYQNGIISGIIATAIVAIIAGIWKNLKP